MNLTKHLQETLEGVREGSDGFYAPSDYLRLRQMQEEIEETITALKPYVMTEVEKYGKEGYKKDGLVITTKSAAGKWTYPSEEHAKAKAEVSKIEERMKMSYKAQQDGGNLMEFDGVVVQPAQYTPGATTLNVSKEKP